MKIKSLSIFAIGIIIYSLFLFLCLDNNLTAEAFAQSDSCTDGQVLVIDTINKRYKCMAISAGGLGSGNINMTVANASSVGTTTGLLAKLTGAPSTVRNAETTDTENAIGVCTSGCGTTGDATIAIAGQVNCQFDGSTTAGNYVVISATSAGKCHDNGSSFPNDKAAYGRVLTTNVGAGTYAMTLMTPDIAFQNAGNGKSRPGGSNGQYQFNDSNSFNGGPLIRESANVVAQRNGASGQQFNIYRVFNNVSSFERLHLGWDGSNYGIYVDNQAGTVGTAELAIGGNPIIFYTNGSNRWSIGTTGHFTPTGSNGGFNIGDSGHRIGQLFMYKQLDFSNVNDATASEPFITHARVWNATGVTMHNFTSNVTNTASAAASTLFEWQVGGTNKFAMNIGGLPILDQTITTGGTTGDQTINKAAGTVNVAAAGTTVTVTNSLVTTSSTIYVSPRTNDSTCAFKNAVPASGSFTINLTAGCTAETSFGFLVIN